MGALIGASASLLVAWLTARWDRAENAKQRQHERDLQNERMRHEKDMQRREANFQRTGIHDLKELGGN
jgi:hypothetical protein